MKHQHLTPFKFIAVALTLGLCFSATIAHAEYAYCLFVKDAKTGKFFFKKVTSSVEAELKKQIEMISNLPIDQKILCNRAKSETLIGEVYSKQERLKEFCENPMSICKALPVFNSQCKSFEFNIETSPLHMQDLTVNNIDTAIVETYKARKGVSEFPMHRLNEKEFNTEMMNFVMEEEKTILADRWDRYATKERMQKLNEVFEKVRGILEKQLDEKIKTLPGDQSGLKLMRKRLSSVRINEKPHSYSIAARFNSLEAYYVYEKNSIDVSLSLLLQMETGGMSSIVGILAHELSHAIDPCAIDKSLGVMGLDAKAANQALYGNLKSCIKENGVNVKLPEFTVEQKVQFSREIGKDPLVFDQITSLIPNCNLVPTPAIQKTPRLQLNESVADYWSSEVLGEVMQEVNKKSSKGSSAFDESLGIASMYGSLNRSENGGVCNLNGGAYGPPGYVNEHPSSSLRMKMIFSNAQLRSAIGCPPSSPTPTGVKACRL
jgi:hypothetical protein